MAEAYPDVPEGSCVDQVDDALLDSCLDCMQELKLEDKLQFVPPLYKQRYGKVADILRDSAVKSVVDFGCAECKVMPFYRKVPSLEEVIGVDLDQYAVTCGTSLIKPLITDYLDRRQKPLRMRLFQGDLTQYDSRTVGVEAVTMIEVIEHLHEPILQQVPEAIFGRLHPSLVVLTTPNVEFNVLFGRDTGFRHYDHKFEWTRQQFRHWCLRIAATYGYCVKFDGIGNPPEDSKSLGHCSQLAVFTRVHPRPNLADSTPYQEAYKLVAEQIHPHQEQNLSESEQAILEAEYYLSFLARGVHSEEELHEDGCHILVSIQRLLAFPKLVAACKDETGLRATLMQKGHKFSSDGLHVLYPIYPLEEDELQDAEMDADSDSPGLVDAGV